MSQSCEKQDCQWYGVNGLNRIFLKKGMVEKDLGHILFISSSSVFFNKTDFEKSLFEATLKPRGGVEDTRLEAKAKDTKKSDAKDSPSEDRYSRGEVQESSRPRSKNTGASVLQIKKRSSKLFFRRKKS